MKRGSSTHRRVKRTTGTGSRRRLDGGARPPSDPQNITATSDNSTAKPNRSRATKDSRKNTKVLRLRLDQPQASTNISPLSSAQDDNRFPENAVILSEGEPRAQFPGSRHRLDAGRVGKKSTLGSIHAHAKNRPILATALSPQPGVEPTPATSGSSVLKVARALDRRARDGARAIPRIDSFLDFLTHHARVKSGSGYVPYHFKGREALLPIVQQLDALLSSGAPDASLALCGGAQFGKTVLMLNLLAYLVAVRFRNVGYYLPDDDLVAGLVDGKLRPDVLDQIPWLARLLQVGKTLAPTGRAVNRKGAFLCTDGTRSALAFMRGLGKIPTSFSMDVVIQDEKDDLPEEHARFLSGRMTASDLRLSLIIGTQRYHGAGQNLAFTEGTQHIGLVRCPGCGKRWNPETSWPGICRLRVGNMAAVDAPRLTTEGHFVWPSIEKTIRHPEVAPAAPCTSPGGILLRCRAGRVEGSATGPSVEQTERHLRTSTSAKNGSVSDPSTALGMTEGGCATLPVASLPPALGTAPATSEGTRAGAESSDVLSRWPMAYSPGQDYYLGCPDCGAELDRANPEWHALAPDRTALRRWSYRLSQLLFPDIDLAQIVAAWQLAIRDPAQMNVFCTDRLALPRSSSQTLTPHDLAAARGNYALGNLDGINGITQLTDGVGKEESDGIDGFGRMEAEDRPSSTHSVHSVHSVQNAVAFGGLDLGDQCWFVARAIEADAPHRARLLWAEPIAAERVRTRVPELFRTLNLRALCVDAGPLRDLSRDLAFALNGLDEEATVSGDDAARNIFFSRGGATLPLRWLASAERWENVRCVPVEFTQREGAGVRHKVARTQEGRVYPLLGAHRDESIARVIREVLAESYADGGMFKSGMLTEGADGVATRVNGPRFLLPTPTESTRGVLDLYERHLLAGSRQERSADGRTLRFIDKCENHFLLATAYAALAELIAPVRDRAADARPLRPVFRALGAPHSRMRARTERSVAG
jgi:hypothetical protein